MRTSPAAFYLLAFTASLAIACNVAVDDKLDDAADDIPDDLDADDLNVKVCGDQTLADLLKADGISDECRDKVESLLPEAQSSFESRLLVLGQARGEDGSRTLYVVGADASGKALFTSAPSELEVSIRSEGKVEALAEGEFSVDLPLEGDLLSLSVVNDYSASMRKEDLEIVSEIETDLFTYMPPIHESEVLQFSEMVSVKQAFSEDRDALLASVAIDDEYERSSTALLDGMGTALDSLGERERPLRVLLVSTDGAENASTMYDEAAVLKARDEHGVIVIMLGALFADVSGLRRLAGDRGVYVYARGYGRLKSAVQGLIESLEHIAAVHLPADVADADEATLELDGQRVTVELTE